MYINVKQINGDSHINCLTCLIMKSWISYLTSTIPQALQHSLTLMASIIQDMTAFHMNSSTSPKNQVHGMMDNE